MDEERRETIMIVEDDPLTALNEKETLEGYGYAVIVATTGEEAVGLAAAEPSADLILMDIDLQAGMDGIEASAAIMRASPKPILFVSSHTDDATLRSLEGVPSYGYVCKASGDSVLAASVGMALRRVQAERKAIAALQASFDKRLAEGETRLRESHHRVRNNIASIRAMLSMQLDTAESPETVSALQDAIGRIEGMGALYDMLALDEDGSDVALKPYIDGLVAAIKPLFAIAPRITIEQNVENVLLAPKRLFALGIIVNELLTNAMKYAFVGKDAGAVRLDVSAYDESIIMTMRDDGNGLPESFDQERSKGLGLTLISMLLDQFGGTLSMRSDNGTVSTVLIQAPGLRLADSGEAAGAKRSAVA